MIERVGVIIPARDEEERIGACLAAVLRAARRSPVPVSVTVVADGCRDRTVAVARSFRGVRVIETDASNVGEGRRIGALGLDSPTTWLLSTDADSVVPGNWISTHVALANDGWDVVLGSVRPEFSELSDLQFDAWHRVHGLGDRDGHVSVHGANLGVRASAYAAVGGYRPMPEHEDQDLADRLTIYRVVPTDRCPVTTSGRSVGRTPGGYARYLRDDLIPAARGYSAPSRSSRSTAANV